MKKLLILFFSLAVLASCGGSDESKDTQFYKKQQTVPQTLEVSIEASGVIEAISAVETILGNKMKVLQMNQLHRKKLHERGQIIKEHDLLVATYNLMTRAVNPQTNSSSINLIEKGDIQNTFTKYVDSSFIWCLHHFPQFISA